MREYEQIKFTKEEVESLLKLCFKGRDTKPKDVIDFLIKLGVIPEGVFKEEKK